MKRIILSLVLVITATFAFGQGKYQMKKINYFVDAAVKEFKLDDSQKKDLLEKRIAYFNDYIAIQKKAKAGDISSEEKKEQTKKVNQTFNKEMGKIIGKNYKEMAPFFKRMKEELKKM